MDLSLVLDEEGVPHELRSLGDGQWALLIEDVDAERAESALQAFERENPLVAPPAPAPREKVEPGAGVVAGWIFALSLLGFHFCVRSEWYARGAADAAAIVHGQWWRAITALTLHADEGHAAGNAILGGFLLALLARRL